MSDFLGSLLERARGDAAVVRPVAAVYRGEPTEPFAIVEEEVEPGTSGPMPVEAAAQPTANARAEPDIRRPPATPPLQPPAEKQEPVNLVVERRVEPPGAEPSPVQPEPLSEPAPAAQIDPPPAHSAGDRRRSRPVDPLSIQPSIDVLPVVVESAEDRSRPQRVSPAAPVGRAEAPRSRRRTRPRSIPTQPKVEPEAPAPHARERLVFAAEPPNEPPTIHISIGRVELRASAPTPAPSPVDLARPKQSLDDYLLARDRRRT